MDIDLEDILNIGKASLGGIVSGSIIGFVTGSCFGDSPLKYTIGGALSLGILDGIEEGYSIYNFRKNSRNSNKMDSNSIDLNRRKTDRIENDYWKYMEHIESKKK